MNSAFGRRRGGWSGLKPARLAVVAGAGIIALAGAWWLSRNGPAAMPFHCLFHDWTGLHCFGCGMTRATAALLDGRIGDAFRFNPLGMVLLPVALLGVSLEAAGWVRGVPPPWRIPLGRHGAMLIVAVMVAFAVLRNLPWWPFTLLAPH